MSINENDRKMNKKVFVALGILTVAIPFIIFTIVYGIGPKPIYEKKDVLSYYGTIVGACFTGYITAAGLYFTLYQNSKTFEKQINENKNSREEDKYGSVMPMLKIDADSSNSVRACLYNNCQPISTESTNYIDLLIKNIGNGPAMKVKIKMDANYLNTPKNNVNEFDLGVNEIINIRIYLEKEHNFNILDTNNFYSDFILECHNIYNKRKYRYCITAIINKESKSIDVFSYKGLEINDI